MQSVLVPVSKVSILETIFWVKKKVINFFMKKVVSKLS